MGIFGFADHARLASTGSHVAFKVASIAWRHLLVWMRAWILPVAGVIPRSRPLDQELHLLSKFRI